MRVFLLHKFFFSLSLFACLLLFTDYAMAALSCFVSQMSCFFLVERQHDETPEEMYWAQIFWGDTAAAA